ncbi:DUF7322 domain-containing protein [Halorussus salinus]|uniref:DUF7322 domain-containing protein n=1 Tax=Halorussus salinus TaxID=1364935 RepID=UPI00192F453D|nr:hypothetical protein [Halorussus salinus]
MAPDDSTPDEDDDSVADILPEDPPQAEADLLPEDPSKDLGPDPPTVPDTSQNEADADLKRRFWSLVLLFNVALFATSLGLMLIGFEGRWRFGGAMFLVGAFAFVRGWRGYQKVQREAEAKTAESETDGDESDPEDEQSDAEAEEADADDDRSDTRDERSGDTDAELQKD